ncbi:50S ribosomal protein L31e [Candidatus Woesearchaeota archaeon]|nr:50S ribosomal protein L31e [Candidatus Woesearchaeota archaeon]
MATLERTYIIPLRKEFQKVPTYKKSKKAMKAVKEFMARHMRTDMENVKVMRELNLAIWKHGIRNPPHKVKVQCTKDDKGVVLVQLFGKPFPQAPKAPEKKGIAAKVAERITGKKEEAKKETTPPTKPEASNEGHAHAKPEEKKETPKPAPKPAAPKPAAPKAPAPAQKPAPTHRQTPQQGH